MIAVSRQTEAATGRLKFAGGLFVLAAALSTGSGLYGVVHVGDKAQLFVDRTLVAATTGVSFTVHPAEKHAGNPVLRCDQPWEDYIAFFGDALHDEQEKLFKLWYVARVPEAAFFENGAAITAHVVAYATSKDGINWEKPPVGTLHSPRFPGHNALVGMQSPVVWKQDDEPDPARRYKMIGVSRLATNGTPKHPTDTYVSPDGIHWSPLGRDIHRTTQDVVNGFYDEPARTYVAIPKQWPYPKVDGLPQRVFGVMTSRDFETWSKPRFIFRTDAIDEVAAPAKIESVRRHFEYPENPVANRRTDIQGVSIYRHESVIVTFPWVFHYFRGKGEPAELRDEGQIEIQIGTLRDDYQTWDRSDRTPVIAPGAWGQWDSGFLFASAKAFRVGDEIFLYYDGGNFTHGFDPKWFRRPRTIMIDGHPHTWRYERAIGLAKWKLDRFVSADAGETSGTVTTVPLIFTGRTLELNAQTEEGGAITVSLCDAAGRPLAGFAQSAEFSGDDLRHRVRFEPSADVARLAGQVVTVRFTLRRASLYSFAFRS